MGVVRFIKYRSGVEILSVRVPGAFASVAELKRLIAATSRRGRGPREDITHRLRPSSIGRGYTSACMFAAFVMFMGISFSIARWKARHIRLAIYVVFVMFLGISFSIAL